MIKINTTLISNFEYYCNMTDANKVFKGISFFLVLLKLPYVSFKFFLFIYVFFREHSRFTGQQGKGELLLKDEMGLRMKNFNEVSLKNPIFRGGRGSGLPINQYIEGGLDSFQIFFFFLRGGCLAKKRGVCVFERGGGGVDTLMHTMSYLLTLNIF